MPEAIEMWLGLEFWIIGEYGNYYHHKLLGSLRKNSTDKNANEKKENSQSGSRWQIPQGALFSLVSCPHYFFEVVSWLGFVIASGFSISSKYQKIRNQNCFEFVTLLSILDFTSFCAKYWF
jgi:steroid 5-alpha reductase family enzyme